jgi:hypothetical protein
VPGTQKAPCRPRLAGLHVLYKLKYGTLSTLYSPMPVAASTLTGRRRPSTRVTRWTIGTATDVGAAYGQRGRGNDWARKLNTESASDNLNGVRPAGEYTQLPHAVRRGYACSSGARRYRLSRRRLCSGCAQLATCMGEAAGTGQNLINKACASDKYSMGGKCTGWVGAVASARRVGPPQRGHHNVACTGAHYLAGRWLAKRSASVVSTAASARGAVSARPVARLRPKRPRCSSISLRGSGFVIRSAGFCVPRTL